MKRGDMIVVDDKYADHRGYRDIVGQVGELMRRHSGLNHDLSIVLINDRYRLIHKEDYFPATENRHFAHLLQGEEDV